MKMYKYEEEVVIRLDERDIVKFIENSISKHGENRLVNLRRYSEYRYAPNGVMYYHPIFKVGATITTTMTTRNKVFSISEEIEEEEIIKILKQKFDSLGIDTQYIKLLATPNFRAYIKPLGGIKVNVTEKENNNHNAFYLTRK